MNSFQPPVFFLVLFFTVLSCHCEEHQMYITQFSDDIDNSSDEVKIC